MVIVSFGFGSRIEEGGRKMSNALFSGICTTNNFLHSLGLLICAGTNGYCCWSDFRRREKRDPVEKKGRRPGGNYVLPILQKASQETPKAHGWSLNAAKTRRHSPASIMEFELLTMNVSKLGLHHCARQSPISQSLLMPWVIWSNWFEDGGARRSSSLRLRPSISSSPGLR